MNISTKLVMEAIKYYSSLGYQMIDVPLVVDQNVSEATKPDGVPDLSHIGGKVYVASAEQSFLQLHKEGKLPDGKYMALTPCYRPERRLSETHYLIFLKLELIEIPSENSYKIMHDSLGFFKPLATKETYFEVTKDGEDIICGDVELGSYGVRHTLDGTSYAYGTGIAEPRFSSCVGRDDE